MDVEKHLSNLRLLICNCLRTETVTLYALKYFCLTIDLQTAFALQIVSIISVPKHTCSN